MQRPPIFSNTPKLASHKGNYGRDYIKQIVLHRYKEIFLHNGSKQVKRNPNKSLIVKKKEIRSPSPTHSLISTLIEKEVNQFLISNPLSVEKLKELEGSIRVKVSQIHRNQTLSTLPTAPTEKLKNIKAIRKSYNQSPAKRRASLGAEHKTSGLQMRRVSEIGTKREKMAKQAFLSRTVVAAQEIETALIPSNRGEITEQNGNREIQIRSGVQMTLPQLSPSGYRSKRGLEVLGLGGGATTSDTFNFKEKQKDEWHRLIQLEVAVQYEKERQKKVRAHEQHRKFRSELDQQIRERKLKQEQKMQEEKNFMAKQMEYVAQEEEREEKKKEELKQMMERQKTEQKALLEKLRKRKEEQFKREREEEIKAAQRVRKLYEQDQIKKLQRAQNERERLMLIMQENQNNQKMLQGHKELERLADQRSLRELERRILDETKRRQASKERTIETKANQMVERREKDKRERMTQEQKALREYQEKMRKEAQEEEEQRKQKKQKERERNKEALGAQVKEKQARLQEERKREQRIAHNLKSQDLSEVEIHELKQMKIRERNIENRKALMEQIQEHKRKKLRGMSPEELNLNKSHLTRAQEVLKKYETPEPLS